MRIGRKKNYIEVLYKKNIYFSENFEIYILEINCQKRIRSSKKKVNNTSC